MDLTRFKFIDLPVEYVLEGVESRYDLQIKH